MDRIFIKPARPGLRVRHPEKLAHLLSQDGEWVTNSSDWQRYLRDGDVVIAQPLEASAEKSKPTKGEAK